MAKKCEEDQVDDLIAQSMIANSLEKNHRNITGSSVLEPAVSGKDFEDPMDKYLADRLAKLRRYPAVFIMSVHFFFFFLCFLSPSTPKSKIPAHVEQYIAERTKPTPLPEFPDDTLEGDEDEQADEIMRQVLDEINLEKT